MSPINVNSKAHGRNFHDGAEFNFNWPMDCLLCFCPCSTMMWLKTQEHWLHALRWIHVDNFPFIVNAKVSVHLSVRLSWSSSAPEGMKRETERKRSDGSINELAVFALGCFTAAWNYWKHFYRVPILRFDGLHRDFSSITCHAERFDEISSNMESRDGFDTNSTSGQSCIIPKFAANLILSQQSVGNSAQEAVHGMSDFCNDIWVSPWQTKKKLLNCLQSSVHPGIVLLTCGGMKALTQTPLTVTAW